MRSMSLIALAAALGACSTAPAPVGPASPEGEARLQSLLAGKVAGEPRTCLPHSRTDNMVIIDDNRVAFRDGSRVYVNQLRGGCDRLGTGFYALVTRSGGGTLCSGEIAQVADLTTGITVGSCALGNFVPYSNP